MGRSGRQSKNRGVSGILRELHEEGLPPGWLDYWQGEKSVIVADKNTVEGNSMQNVTALSAEERSKMLFPLIWEATQEIEGQRNRIAMNMNTKRADCLQLANKIAPDPVADEIEDFYNLWRQRVGPELYSKVLQAADRVSAGSHVDFIQVWASIFRSTTKENRMQAIRRYLPSLLEKEREDLLQSMPPAHRLIVSGDSSIRANLANGKWLLEPVWGSTGKPAV